MKRKLLCAIVDDDPKSHDTIAEFMKDSTIMELSHHFYNGSDFIKSEPTIKCDLCLLDIMLPDMSGFDVAKKINKPYIFISGYKDKILEAIEMEGPIDIVSKPTQAGRLNAALEKGYLRIVGSSNMTEKQYELFNVAEKRGHVNIYLPDIYYAKTDYYDRRNKQVILKSGLSFTFMDCTFDRMLNLSSKLCQVNKSELISIEMLELIEHDIIFLKKMEGVNAPLWVTFSGKYKDHFYGRMNALKVK